jgi:hypothetical protein
MVLTSQSEVVNFSGVYCAWFYGEKIDEKTKRSQALARKRQDAKKKTIPHLAFLPGRRFESANYCQRASAQPTQTLRD